MKGVLEMTLKVIRTGKVTKGKSLKDSRLVYNAMRFLKKKDREHFYVLHLDSACKMIGKELISIGMLNSALVHPREVFKGAILNNSAAIICVHNHPSGSLKPSKEDIDITRRLIKTGEIIGIPVVDHAVISCEGLASVMEYCTETQTQVAKKSMGEDKKQELLAAKEVAKERGFNQTIKKWFEREDFPVSEKIIGLVHNSVATLSMAKATLNNEDLFELKDYELLGIKYIIEDVFNLLDGATDFHARTH